MSPVLIVGAGPVDLTVAAELARHGVQVRIVDRSPQPSILMRETGRPQPDPLQCCPPFLTVMTMAFRGLTGPSPRVTPAQGASRATT